MSDAPRITPTTEERFANAMRAEGRFPKDGVPAGLGIKAAATEAKPLPLPEIRPGDVDLGEIDTGGAMGVDLGKLIDGRLLIQGASGAGKSWTLRRLLEQTVELIPQIIIDPEGEFKSLAEKFGHLHVEAHLLDIASLATIAQRAREHRLSLLLDMSDLDREGQMKAVAAFLYALVEAPREHWRPVLVAIDEAHLFAPFGGQVTAATAVRKAAIDALTNMMSRGRKRGICGILATMRLARLAKSVASEVHNFMVGLNTLDLDIRRAAETIGWDARRAFDRLPMLEPGDFVAVGPAFSRSPGVLRVGPIQTKHIGASPTLMADFTDVDQSKAAELLDLQALLESSAADAVTLAEGNLSPGYRGVREFMRDPAFVPAAKVFGALVPLAPEGARVSDLESHLSLSEDEATEALALLDIYGALEFDGDGAERAVRLARGMLT